MVEFLTLKTVILQHSALSFLFFLLILVNKLNKVPASVWFMIISHNISNNANIMSSLTGSDLSPTN